MKILVDGIQQRQEKCYKKNIQDSLQTTVSMKQDNKITRVDKGWDKMIVTLDDQMPQKKKRRRF